MDNYNLKKIGENIKNQRLAAKYTLHDVGANLGVSGKQVCIWESGETIPSIKKIIKLCKFFNCNFNDIVDIPVSKSDISYKSICDKLEIDGKTLNKLRELLDLYTNEELQSAIKLLIKLKEVQND